MNNEQIARLTPEVQFEDIQRYVDICWLEDTLAQPGVPEKLHRFIKQGGQHKRAKLRRGRARIGYSGQPMKRRRNECKL